MTIETGSEFKISPDWKEIHEKAVVFDIHVHPGLKAYLFEKALGLPHKSRRIFDPTSIRTDFPDLLEGGIDGILSVATAPEKQIVNDCRYLRFLRYILPRAQETFEKSPFEVTDTMLTLMEEEVKQSINPDNGKPYAIMVKSVRDLEETLGQEERPTMVIHSIEGAHSLAKREGSSIENLEYFFDRGVAYMTLAHFYENDVAPPVFPFPERLQKFGCFDGRRDETRGLSVFGQQAVERMTEIGMLVDITHCTPVARRQVFDIVGNRRPILATHVGVQGMGNFDSYNLTDREIKRIAENGGVVGVIFSNDFLVRTPEKRGIDNIVETVKYLKNVGGTTTIIAIGSDFDGFTDPPDDLFEASQMPFLTQALVTKGLMGEGFSEADILKILGENAIRVLREGWGKSQ